MVSHTFTISGFQATQGKLQDVIDCRRFSSLYKLLRTTAYVTRFVRKLLNRSNPNTPLTFQGKVSCSLPTVDEINEVKTYWIKAIQGDSFHTEFKYLTTNKPVGNPIRVKQFGLFLE